MSRRENNTIRRINQSFLQVTRNNNILKPENGLKIKYCDQSIHHDPNELEYSVHLLLFMCFLYKKPNYYDFPFPESHYRLIMRSIFNTVIFFGPKQTIYWLCLGDEVGQSVNMSYGQCSKFTVNKTKTDRSNVFKIK